MNIKMMIMAAASIAVATPALASDFVVPYKDLDLSSAKDRKVLEKRIDAASRDYCGADLQITGSRITGAGSAECVASARKLAREQLAQLLDETVQKGG